MFLSPVDKIWQGRFSLIYDTCIITWIQSYCCTTSMYTCYSHPCYRLPFSVVPVDPKSCSRSPWRFFLSEERPSLDFLGLSRLLARHPWKSVGWGAEILRFQNPSLACPEKNRPPNLFWWMTWRFRTWVFSKVVPSFRSCRQMGYACAVVHAARLAIFSCPKPYSQFELKNHWKGMKQLPTNRFFHELW